MPKLSKEQIRLLVWLSKPHNHLEICQQDGYALNQINGLLNYVDYSGKPYKFDKRTLNKLKDESLVKVQTIYPFGIKHFSYSLTNTGFEFVNGLTE